MKSRKINEVYKIGIYMHTQRELMRYKKCLVNYFYDTDTAVGKLAHKVSLNFPSTGPAQAVCE